MVRGTAAAGSLLDGRGAAALCRAPHSVILASEVRVSLGTRCRCACARARVRHRAYLCVRTKRASEGRRRLEGHTHSRVLRARAGAAAGGRLAVRRSLRARTISRLRACAPARACLRTCLRERMCVLCLYLWAFLCGRTGEGSERAGLFVDGLVGRRAWLAGGAHAHKW